MKIEDFKKIEDLANVLDRGQFDFKKNKAGYLFFKKTIKKESPFTFKEIVKIHRDMNEFRKLYEFKQMNNFVTLLEFELIKKTLK
jgi:hypothetical protein